jgi:MFS family permease
VTDVGSAAPVAHPLQDAQFRWFFAGRLVSMTGSSMVWVALTFAILEASGSAGDLGIVLASYTVPLGLLQVFGGALADRFSRSAVLVVSHLGAALTQGVMAALLLTGNYRLPVAVLVVGAFVSGAGTGVYGIAYETSIHEHVPNDKLSRVASIDALAALVPVPLGQLAVIPLAAAFGGARVAVVWVAYAVVALAVLAVRPVRMLRHETAPA